MLKAVHTIKLKVGIRLRDTTRRAKDIYAPGTGRLPTRLVQGGTAPVLTPQSLTHDASTTIYLLERTIVTGDLVGPHWMAVPRRQGPWPGRGHESTTEA